MTQKTSTRVTTPIFLAAGAQPEAGAIGKCRTCGMFGMGQLFADWVKPTFTDHDKLQPGEIVCAPCLFCFTDQNEELAHILGKPEPQRFRNYSHFVTNGVWTPLSKGDKLRMAELIYDSEVIVIALSGQKHLAFRCPPGWWQIEEHTVRPFPGLLRELSESVTRLYQGGFSKTEIETGNYIQSRVMEYGLLKWSDDEGLIRKHRGTLPLQLAVFLAQKEDDGDKEKE